MSGAAGGKTREEEQDWEFLESVKKKKREKKKKIKTVQERKENNNSKATRTKGKGEFSHLMYAVTILNKLYKV